MKILTDPSPYILKYAFSIFDRYKSVLIAVVYIYGAYIIGKQISIGIDFLSLVKIIFIFSPIIFYIIMKFKPFWIAISLGLLPFYNVIPVVVLDRLQISSLIGGMISIIVLMEVVVKKIRIDVFKTFESRCILFAVIIVFARVLYDRPGSARMGGQGGGNEAFQFMLALTIFIVFSIVASWNWDIRGNYRKMRNIILGIFLYYLISSLITAGLNKTFFHLFKPDLWMISSFMLVWIYEKNWKQSKSVHKYKIIIMILFLLFLGLLSPYRSRPFFALGIILFISYIYRYLKHTIVIIFSIIILAYISPISQIRNRIPDSIKRSVSTLISFRRGDIINFQGSNEFGWNIGFRKTLFNMAIDDIKENPLWGKGFSFSNAELLQSMHVSIKGFDEGQAMSLTGGYHNSLLELGAMCGLPTLIFFSIGYILIFIKFIQSIRIIKDPKIRCFSATLVGFFAVWSGLMLTNGGGTEFYPVCLILGIMNGILYKIRKHYNGETVQ